MAKDADLGMEMPPDMNAQDDIEKIMNEIENMREDMKTTVASKDGPAAKSKALAGSSASAQKSSDTTAAQEQQLDEIVREMAANEVPQVPEPDTVPEPVSDADDSGFLPQSAARVSESSSESESEEIPGTPLTKSQGEEAWLEETYANLRDSGTPMSEAPDTADGSLTLLVQGSMTVRLRHERTGQEVGVSFVGDSIHVYLADGAELTIPVKMKNPAFDTGRNTSQGAAHKAGRDSARKKRAA